MESINPTDITTENIPIVLGIILMELKEIKEKNTNMEIKFSEIEKKIDTHTKFFEIFNFSKCKVIPFLMQNKLLFGFLFAIVSFWISILTFMMDWISRAIQ